jgi:hypothetical protein
MGKNTQNKEVVSKNASVTTNKVIGTSIAVLTGGLVGSSEAMVNQAAHNAGHATAPANKFPDGVNIVKEDLQPYVTGGIIGGLASGLLTLQQLNQLDNMDDHFDSEHGEDFHEPKDRQLTITRSAITGWVTGFMAGAFAGQVTGFAFSFRK